MKSSRRLPNLSHQMAAESRFLSRSFQRQTDGDHVSNLPPAESACAEPAPKRARPTPEASFTPTAEGPRPEGAQHPQIDAQLSQLIVQVVQWTIDATLKYIRQAGFLIPDSLLHQGQPTAANNQREFPVLPKPHSPASSILSPGYFSDDEEQNELMLSEDKVASDPPAFRRLFNPALFEPLLRKATATAATSDPALGLFHPSPQPSRGNGSRRSRGDPSGTRPEVIGGLAKWHQRARGQSSPLTVPGPDPPILSPGYFSDDDEELMLSENKGVASDPSVFRLRLFNPALFEPLLRKATVTLATDPALGLCHRSPRPSRGNGSRRSRGDPSGTRPEVAGSLPKRHQRARGQSSPLSPPTVPGSHLQPPHTPPNRQHSYKELYELLRGHSRQVPRPRSQASGSLGGIGDNQESTGRGSGVPTLGSPLA